MTKNNACWEIPQRVRQKVLTWFGSKGEAWLASLPLLVEQLSARWGLCLGPAYTGGTHALVLRARHADGRPTVLKIPYLEDENRLEADALRHYAGNGAVMLYDADESTGALLLDRLEPGTPLIEHPDRAAAIDNACGLMRRLWRPAPTDHRFLLVRDLAAEWATALPVQSARVLRPVPAAILDEVIAFARSLAAGGGGAEVVVNRDIHLDNILAAEREPWLLIDPKPLVGDRAFDTGFFVLAQLWDDPNAEAAQRLVMTMARQLDLDPQPIRSWALLRAVEKALWIGDAGQDPNAAKYLAQAAAVAKVTT